MVVPLVVWFWGLVVGELMRPWAWWPAVRLVCVRPLYLRLVMLGRLLLSLEELTKQDDELLLFCRVVLSVLTVIGIAGRYV